MGVIGYIKSTAGEHRSLLAQNKQIIDAYNFHILKILLFFSVGVTFVLAMLSLIPAVDYLYHFKYQVFFSASLCLFFLFSIICLLAGQFVGMHAIPAMYVFVVFVDSFSVILNLITKQAPYTVTLGFLIIVPMLMLDYRLRVFAVNTAIVIICLLVSYYYKDDEYFFIDLFDCLAFGGVGIFVGDLFRMNNMRYLDLKEHELDRNVEVLRAKNEAKSSFLANMSHEIRTPINAVLGLNEMILRESTEPNVLSYAGDIKNAGRTLVSLINDILDFSKIEANKMVIIPVEYQLHTLVNDLVNMITPRAQERGLKLRVTVAEDTPSVLYGDDIRIKQCILNLLTNAVKYTNEGYIDLMMRWRPLDDRNLMLMVLVKDTGAGIKQENLARLFSAFERIEEKRFRTTEGTGLGISIVQRLLGKMDSELHVESEYGSGSTFWFELQQGIVQAAPVGKMDMRVRETEVVPQSYREMFHAPDARILVVDDMKINLDVICGLLKRTRIQIDTALSGNEALRLVGQHAYDVIFIDHRMPEMDGIETLHAIRSHEAAGNDTAPVLTPCIALTANAISGAREMYLKEGFVDYISKPVDYLKLEELLMKYLPKQLVQKASAMAAQPFGALSDTSESSAERDPFLNKYYQVPGINASAALDFCGDLEVLRGAVHDYYESITMQSALIEKYAAQHDIKNYMILVHGLKSSSRLVGAEKLSKDAAYLEQCAKDGNEAEIDRLTADLLVQFRALKKPFAAVLGEKYDEAFSVPPPLAAPQPTVSASPAEKAPMDEEQVHGALFALAEFIQADDFGAAENILSMVEEYEIPLESDETFGKIKEAVLAKDKPRALELLGAARSQA